jgi:Protein of unknown function (DUF1565)
MKGYKRNFMNKGINFSLARLLVSVMLILLLLIACGTDTTTTETTEPPASDAADFSLSVSGAVSAVQGAQAQADISITRTNGFSEAVTLSVNDLPAGVTPTFTPNPITGATSVLSLAVARSVAPGDYPLTLEGNAGSLKKTAPLVLTVTLAPSDINAVAIQGNSGSNQVRQGAGVITVGVAGRGLKDISSASLGTLSGTVVTNNDKAASLTFTIPSGAEVGPQTLRLETALGVVEKEEAVTISKITVSNAGDDTTGKGTPDKPFKTMRFAIGLAASGDTVRLLDGTYNQASGEVFPFAFPSGVTLTLEGESETGTIIDEADSLNLDCLIVTDSEVTISTMTVTDCNSGIEARGTAVVTISNITLTENATGLAVVDDTAQVRMENSTARNNRFNGVFVSGDSRLEIRGGSISGNGTILSAANGVTTRQGAAGVLRLEGVTLDSNSSAGLDVRTQGTVEVFNCVIRNNSENGIHLITLVGVAPSLFNLGDATNAGNNTITDNSLFQLNDERPASSVVITAYGNTIGSGSVVSGLQTGVDSDGTSWQITSAGNQIDFGP